MVGFGRFLAQTESLTVLLLLSQTWPGTSALSFFHSGSLIWLSTMARSCPIWSALLPQPAALTFPSSPSLRMSILFRPLLQEAFLNSLWLLVHPHLGLLCDSSASVTVCYPMEGPVKTRASLTLSLTPHSTQNSVTVDARSVSVSL